MSDKDGTIEFDVDEASYLKQINAMVSKTIDRFAQVGRAVAGVFSGGGTSVGSFNQSPAARTTKELEAQVKSSKELLKIERDKYTVQRAARFDAARRTYGEGAELDTQGRLRESMREKQRAQTRRYIGTTGSMINAGWNAATSGGSLQGGVQLGAAIASALAPELAPIIAAASNVITQAANRRDRFRENALTRFQTGGAAGVDFDEDTDVQAMHAKRIALGYDISSFSTLYNQANRKGALGGQYATSDMSNFMQSQVGLGIGSNVMNATGSAYRSGSATQGERGSDKVIGNAVGIALSEGLSRGRIGEAFDKLAAAMDDNSEAVADMSATADRLAFVGSLGPQFKGNSSASQSMDQSLKSLLQGGTPYNQMSSLVAGGFGSGASYQTAWMKGQLGLDKEGGIKTENELQASFGGWIGPYAKGNADQKNMILLQLSQLTSMSGGKLKALMDKLASKGYGHVDAAAGKSTYDRMKNVPKNALEPRAQKAAGDDQGMGVGDMTQGIYGPVGQSASSSQTNATSQAFTDKYVSKGTGSYGASRNGTAHPGVDLNFPPGSVIYSPCTGTVLFAKTGSGNEVGMGLGIKEDSTGLVYKIFHLVPSTVTVKSGSSVTKGQRLGMSSKTAFSKNVPSHVHLGIEQDGKPVDPAGATDMDSLINPDTERTITPDLGKGSPVSSSETGVGAGAGDTGSSGGGSSTVSVKVTVFDATQNGVNVKHETEKFGHQASSPATGDAPAIQRGD